MIRSSPTSLLFRAATSCDLSLFPLCFFLFAPEEEAASPLFSAGWRRSTTSFPLSLPLPFLSSYDRREHREPARSLLTPFPPFASGRSDSLIEKAIGQTPLFSFFFSLSLRHGASGAWLSPLFFFQIHLRPGDVSPHLVKSAFLSFPFLRKKYEFFFLFLTGARVLSLSGRAGKTSPLSSPPHVPVGKRREPSPPSLCGSLLASREELSLFRHYIEERAFFSSRLTLLDLPPGGNEKMLPPSPQF